MHPSSLSVHDVGVDAPELIVSTSAVLHRNKAVPQNEIGAVSFVPKVDEFDETRCSMVMTVEHWVELGKPNRVTVTIEPGDRLG